MSTFTIKCGDTAPSLRAVLSDSSGPVDLTLAASVTLRMQRVVNQCRDSAAERVVERDAVKEDAPAGQVRVDWQDGDIYASGRFKAEFVVVNNGRRQRFPSSGYFYVDVKPSV